LQCYGHSSLCWRILHDACEFVDGIASATGGNVILDFVDPDGDGAATLDLQRRYLYGEAVDQILAQEDVTQLINSADRILWPLTDNLGTVRDLIKNDGVLGEHYKYDSFGAITSGNTSLTRYLFTSREFDTDTNLQYNRARYYDATTGRWLSHDPLSFAAGDTNTYRYVGNNAMNATDPSGLKIKIRNGENVDDLLYRAALKRLKEDLERMRKMDGIIGAMMKRMDEKGRTYNIDIMKPDYDPEGTLIRPILKAKTISLPSGEDDYVPGPLENFPDGTGIGPEERRIIVLMHEAGHAVMLFKDPENVNFENLAREQLGVDLRDDYKGKEITDLTDREQKKVDILLKQSLKKSVDPMLSDP